MNHERREFFEQPLGHWAMQRVHHLELLEFRRGEERMMQKVEHRVPLQPLKWL
jgi:hypothetical protein